MATWYVRPTGDTYGNDDGTTYADAWAGFSSVVWGTGGVTAGDTLYICGTHGEAFTVGGSGSNGSPIVISGNYTADPGAIDINKSANDAFIINGRSYITVNNLDVGDAIQQGVRVYGNNITLNSVVSHDHGSADYVHSNGFDIYSYGPGYTHTVTLNDCISYNNAACGFKNTHFTYDIEYNRCVAYNNCAQSLAHGFSGHPERQSVTSGWTQHSGNIYYRAHSLTSVTRVINQTDGPSSLTRNEGNYATLGANEWDLYSGNVYVNVGATPNGKTVRFVNEVCYNITFNDCIAYSNISYGGGNTEGHGICADDYTNNVTLRRCMAYANDGDGFVLAGGKDSHIEYCLAYDNGRKGFWVGWHSENIEVYNSVAANNPAGAGFDFGAYGDGLTIKNCISKGNTWGVSGYTTFANRTFDYNCVHGNATGAYNNATPGANSITSDPLFINFAADDYRLQPTSPCIDAGANLSLTLDLLRCAVYTGTAPNMGVYETRVYVGLTTRNVLL